MIPSLTPAATSKPRSVLSLPPPAPRTRIHQLLRRDLQLNLRQDAREFIFGVPLDDRDRTVAMLVAHTQENIQRGLAIATSHSEQQLPGRRDSADRTRVSGDDVVNRSCSAPTRGVVRRRIYDEPGRVVEPKAYGGSIVQNRTAEDTEGNARRGRRRHEGRAEGSSRGRSEEPQPAEVASRCRERHVTSCQPTQAEGRRRATVYRARRRKRTPGSAEIWICAAADSE